MYSQSGDVEVGLVSGAVLYRVIYLDCFIGVTLYYVSGAHGMLSL